MGVCIVHTRMRICIDIQHAHARARARARSLFQTPNTRAHISLVSSELRLKGSAADVTNRRHENTHAHTEHTHTHREQKKCTENKTHPSELGAQTKSGAADVIGEEGLADVLKRQWPRTLPI